MTKSIHTFYKILFLFALSLALFTACSPGQDPDDIGADQDRAQSVDEITDDPGNPYAGTGQAAPVQVFPFFHAAVGFKYAGEEILVDPYNGAERYTDGFENPGLVLITHTHSDHLDMETLKGLTLGTSTIIGPKAVTDQLKGMDIGDVRTLANGDSTEYHGMLVRAVPAYNYPQGTDPFHEKGEFNGYIITMGEENYYISGDTGPTPELKDLDVIDYAFVSMNQPYTMTVEDAAKLVAEMGAGTIYPYHYRNKDGTFSDVEKFAEMVDEMNVGSEVILEDWYRESE